MLVKTVIRKIVSEKIMKRPNALVYAVYHFI